MLYVFMECALGAPKLFNAIEIRERKISCDGVYYIKKGTISDMPMLVLGASKAFPSISKALENSLLQAEIVAKNQDEILPFINPAFLKLRFDHDDLLFITDKLLKAQGLLENDAAFGIFLSYSINEKNDGNMNSQEYKERIEERMKKDLLDAIPIIYEKIHSHNLQNYSFFVFILPLTDVDKDVTSIIRKLNFTRGSENV